MLDGLGVAALQERGAGLVELVELRLVPLGPQSGQALAAEHEGDERGEDQTQVEAEGAQADGADQRQVLGPAQAEKVGGEVSPVERQDREKVEYAPEDVHPDQHLEGALHHAGVRRHHLGEGHAHDGSQEPGGGAGEGHHQ